MSTPPSPRCCWKPTCPPAIARGFNLIARCAGLVGHILEEMQEPAGFHIWKLAEEGVPYAD